MAFKSKAHRTRYQELVKEGKISQAEYDRHEAETPRGELPDRLTLKRIQIPQIKNVGKVKVIK